MPRRRTDVPRANSRLALSSKNTPSPKPTSNTWSVSARNAQRASKAAINGGVRTNPWALSAFFIPAMGSPGPVMRALLWREAGGGCKRKRHGSFAMAEGVEKGLLGGVGRETRESLLAEDVIM